MSALRMRENKLKIAPLRKTTTYMFSPFLMMTSFSRSLMNKNPSSSIRPMSPVLNHPSEENDSFVAFSLFQYPECDC